MHSVVPVRVLVTGGAGFIGSHLVDAMAGHGDAVAAVDDLSTGSRDRLDPRIDLHRIDVRDGRAVSDVVGRFAPQVIFHLAAQVDVRRSVNEPTADAATNVLGTVNVLHAALSVGARVIFTSSGGAIYGEAPVAVSESAAPAPSSPYGVGKWCAEEYCRLFGRLHGLSTAVLRLGNVYGPRQDPQAEGGVVSILAGRIKRGQPQIIFGDGLQTRDYVYVTDVVRALRLVATGPHTGVWNVATGRGTSVRGLLELVCRSSGVRVAPHFAERRPGELTASILSTEAAERDIGFAAAVPLSEGVARVVRWVAQGAAPRGPA